VDYSNFVLSQKLAHVSCRREIFLLIAPITRRIRLLSADDNVEEKD
jgi:hypothetical protein